MRFPSHRVWSCLHATRRRHGARTVFPLLLACLWAVSAPPGHAADRPVRILALGDSLTAGYGLAHADGFVPRLQAALDARGDAITILDGGVSGDTSTDALARLDWALGDNPDAVIVELGGNDGLRGLDPARMEQNLTTILDRLQQAHLPVLLSGMYAPPNMGAGYSQSFRAVFERLSHRPGILWDPFFLDGVAAHPELEQADHIHPNPAGVAVIVARMVPLVERLARRP
ncbi:arylesterase [Gluconacetobacter aggeris]|uniref:Arylesterase n=1 Tax=Gluconacetobacter aggeris TaxID=1286186 RepID=A0A7W4NUY5_9PROT|nr:arylesterase [Gluconacetobacter aggeris]MBB2167246.1 arylesterase [Gluconacetobacter aggeris]